jgi:integrase
MANARLLPSGAYRTRATKVVNGKKITKSFTVHPKECQGNTKKAKLLSENKASKWQLASDHAEMYGMTVKQAIEGYISDKERVLSPSTIRGYKLILDVFQSLWNISIYDIETPQIQRLVNEWSYVLKTKTIKNRITMLLSVLDYQGIDKRFKIRYPQSNSKKVTTPDIQDVQMFIENAKDDFKPIIYLAAFGSLRRGEIAGLREVDISRDMNTITVNGVKVLNSDGKWIYKPFPKTKDSMRTIQLPKEIIDCIPVKDNSKDFVFTLTPAAMTDRFKRLADKLQLPYTLHSMRHFAASFRTDLGIPKKYIQEVGGWLDGNGSVFERIYDNTMESSRRKYTKMANEFIEETFFRDRKIN